MIPSGSSLFSLALVTALLQVASPQAIVVRHDKSDAETLTLGRRFVAAGRDYGVAGAGFLRTDGKRRAVTNVIDDAGPKRIFMTFDAPPGGSTLEGVGAPGDSGGPAFIEERGQLFLVGVSSASMNGKPGAYGVTDVYTRISSYVDWVEKIVSR